MSLEIMDITAIFTEKMDRTAIRTERKWMGLPYFTEMVDSTAI